MNTAEATPTTTDWKLPSHRKAGIICLIITESALFSIFVVAFVFYIGKSLTPPYPREVLDLPLFASVCLFGSSFTVHWADKALRNGATSRFHLWWIVTIILGVVFLGYTAHEWYVLIYEKHLTISTNVFGTTFYSLVGLHASHVIVGLILLTIVLVSSMRGKLDKAHHEHAEMISWYWHFVDWIWAVVFFVVYILGRYWS